MTDQADALAGKLKRWDQEYSYAWFVAEYAKRGFQDGSATIAYFTGLAAVATAHFAEEIAEIHRCWKIDQDHIQKELRPQIATLAAENERLKKLDAEFAVAMTEAMTENERLKGECQEREESFNILVRTAAGIQADREKERVRAEQAEGERDEQAAKHADCCVDRQDLADAIHAKTGWRIRAVQAEATLVRVREGLTRERIAEAIYNVLIPHEYKMSLEEAHSLRSERLGRGTETTRECYALADAILALLAPEGNP